MHRTLFTDADNTLWETDAVYVSAQLGLLRDVESLLKARASDSDDEALAYLRVIDQGIAQVHPDRLRYPPLLLARGLGLALSGESAQDAIRKSLCEGARDDLFVGPLKRFAEALRATPNLRPGVSRALGVLRSHAEDVVVVTESALERCVVTLQAHALDWLIPSVVADVKSAELYRRLGIGKARPMMVGDQMDRDVAFSQQAGYETVFFRGAFTPSWTKELTTEPDHRIARYDELLGLLNLTSEL